MTSLAGAGFWATPGLLPLLDVLNTGGEEARVVGGAVRNTLLGLPVSDVDIATTARPEVVSERVRRAGMKPVPTGIAHGTVTVVVDHHAFEVTTLREDTETDGRRAVVRFGRSWQHDAERRDFTLNALYAAPDGTVMDLVGGLADVAARRVRFIGDARARIREDYLRILRLFRFHAAYASGPVDAAALRAAEHLRAGLRTLSHERVRAELLKLLLARGAPETVAIMSCSGLLQPLLAGIGDLSAFARMVGLEAERGVPPDAVRRLAALALRVADDVPRLRERLRLSNAEARRLAALAGPLPLPEGPKAIRALIYEQGAETVIDRALLAAARGREGFAPVVEMARSWAAPQRPFGAADLIALGLRPGPALGAALAQAERAWIAAGFPQDAGQITALLEDAIRPADR